MSPKIRTCRFSGGVTIIKTATDFIEMWPHAVTSISFLGCFPPTLIVDKLSLSRFGTLASSLKTFKIETVIKILASAMSLGYDLSPSFIKQRRIVDLAMAAGLQ